VHPAAGEADALCEGAREPERDGVRVCVAGAGLSEELVVWEPEGVGREEGEPLSDAEEVAAALCEAEGPREPLADADTLTVPLSEGVDDTDRVGVADGDAPVDSVAVAVADGEAVLLGVGCALCVTLTLQLADPVWLPVAGALAVPVCVLLEVTDAGGDWLGVRVCVRLPLCEGALDSVALAVAVADALSDGSTGPSGSTSFTL